MLCTSTYVWWRVCVTNSVSVFMASKATDCIQFDSAFECALRVRMYICTHAHTWVENHVYKRVCVYVCMYVAVP